MANIAETVKKQTDRILRQQNLNGTGGVVVSGVATGTGAPVPTVNNSAADLAAHKISGDHDSRYPQAFTDLTDAPAAYTGEGGKIVAVKYDVSGLEFVAAPAAENGVPVGGTTNQLAAKNSNADYDVKWVDAPAAGNGLPAGGTAGQVLEKIDGTDYNAQWADPRVFYGNQIDEPPANPHAEDDEFEGDTLDGKWSWANQGAATAAVGDLPSMLTLTGELNSSHRCLVQPVPAGNWSVIVKVHFGGNFWADAYAGFVLLPATDGGVEALVIGKDGTSSPTRIRAERWNNWTSWGTERRGANYGPTHVYLRIDWDNTAGKVSYFISDDGISWPALIKGGTLSFTPGRFGLTVRGSDLPQYFEFFRILY